MQKLRAVFGGFSPIAITAMLSVALLISVTTARVVIALRPASAETVPTALAALTASSSEEILFAQQQMLLLGESDLTDMRATSTTDHLSLIGPMIAAEILGTYAQIRDSGEEYTKEDLRSAAAKIAEHMKAVVAYAPFDNSDFKTDSDSSTERVRSYRDDMVNALKPLSSIPSAEYVIYGHYVETSDPIYIQQLKDAAESYRQSANNAALIVVPRDAVNYHRDLLNSLRAFASVLDGLASHGDDPFASVALLRTYNDKEKGIYDAFDNMRAYYGKKEL
ncbi:MAG: hypothetical protein KBD06_05035 [Candidatus Pacebacteria bacterium]|nr:hypothetical protein [Candidatus Paceibacterota bacterium]